MKLYNFGWWYRKRHYNSEYNELRDEYSNVYSPGFSSLLFDGHSIALKYPFLGPWVCESCALNKLVKLFDNRLLVYLEHGSYAFKEGYVPKPEDFEVIREAS